MLLGLVMVITLGAYQQDTVTHKDSLPPPPVPAPAPVLAPVPVPPPAPPQPTIEQIRFMEGLKTATRGIAQIKNGVERVVRTQQAGDSLTRRRAARRLGGLCGTARSFIVSGRPKMQAAAYADTMRVLAKQLTTRLDSLNAALPICETAAGGDPSTVATTLTTRLKNYDDALLAFRNGLKPDSTKTVSQQ
jgi:hypothetical protein